MIYAKKFMLIPENRVQDDVPRSLAGNEQTGGNLNAEQIVNQSKNEQSKHPNRILTLLKIALQLTKSGKYNLDGNLLSDDGAVIPNTNIYSLIKAAATPGRLLSGQKDFIRILSECNVQPTHILNDTLRTMLIEYNNSKKTSTSVQEEKNADIPLIEDSDEQQPTSTPNTDTQFMSYKPSRKRKRISLRNGDNDSDYGGYSVKIPRWDYNGNK